MDIQRVGMFLRTVLGPAKKAEDKQPSPKDAGGGDQVQISADARKARAVQEFTDMVQTAKSLDSTDSERVEQARARVASGEYLKEEVSREVASKVLEDLV